MSVVSVVSYQVEVSAMDWPVVQMSPIECGVPECIREASIFTSSWPTGGSCAMGQGGGPI
jgi:hypothetical protein